MKSAAALPASVKALNVSVAEPLLLTLTLCAALLLPSVCAAKFSDVAFSEMADCGNAVPLPFSVMAVGDPVALWLMARLALRAPVAVGAKAIFSTHEAFGGTEPPTLQVLPLASRNSLACAPLISSALISKGALPLLLTVAVCAADVLLTTWLKLSVVGDTPITGFSATPVPDRLVLLDPPLALCVTTRLALRAPAVDGVKPMLSVQLAPAATDPLATQLPPLSVNSVLPVDKLPSSSGALPVFDSVAVCAALEVPRFTLPKASEAVMAAAGAAAAVALPLRLTTPGLPVALWATVKVPLRAPSAPVDGLKTSDTVQLAPSATLPPALQLPPAMLKSAGFDSVSAEIASGALPLLLTLTFCAALVEPMAVAASVIDIGEMFATGASSVPLAPVPLSAMLIGVSAWL